MALKTCEMLSNGIEIAAFSKKSTKNCPVAWAFLFFRPLSYASLLTTTASLNLNIITF